MNEICCEKTIAMETENPQDAMHNVQNGWRTRQEKDVLITQWQQSGKSRKVFRVENELNYKSFVTHQFFFPYFRFHAAKRKYY